MLVMPTWPTGRRRSAKTRARNLGGKRTGTMFGSMLPGVGRQELIAVSPAGNRWHAANGVVSLPATRLTVVHGRIRGPKVTSMSLCRELITPYEDVKNNVRILLGFT